ncbi:MAG: type II secretion system protein GspM [Rhodospirillales bacterium]
MMIQLSPPASRVVAIGLVFLVAATFYAIVVRPLVELYGGQQQTIVEQRQLLDRYERYAGERADLAEQLEALQNDRSAQEGYLQGDNETLVAAQLQNRIRSVVQATGAKLASTQVLQAAEEANFRRISVRVTMTCSVIDLQKIFHQLEGGRPYLFLDNVDVSGEQARRRSGEGGSVREDLNVSFDVYGFMRAS